MNLNTTYQGEAKEILKTFPDKSVNCIVTSPPYYKQRKYGHPNELGHEKTPELYIERLCDIMDEAKRVLMDEGICYINISDSYWGSGKQGQLHVYSGKKTRPGIDKEKQGLSTKDKHPFLKPKDLIGIPWALAFEMRKRGWWLRQDNTWNKTNPQPESVKDRSSRSHEYVFMFTKSYNYYYDAESVKTVAKTSSRLQGKENAGGELKGKINKQDGHGRRYKGFNERWNTMTPEQKEQLGANRKSVWNIATVQSDEDHYAMFPPELARICILSACPEGDVVLDMFHGSGNTGMVAVQTGRKFVGIDIVEKNVKMADRRINNKAGLFL